MSEVKAYFMYIETVNAKLFSKFLADGQQYDDVEIGQVYGLKVIEKKIENKNFKVGFSLVKMKGEEEHEKD